MSSVRVPGCDNFSGPRWGLNFPSARLAELWSQGLQLSVRADSCPGFLSSLTLLWWLSWTETQSKQHTPSWSLKQDTPGWCPRVSAGFTVLQTELIKQQTSLQGRRMRWEEKACHFAVLLLTAYLDFPLDVSPWFQCNPLCDSISPAKHVLLFFSVISFPRGFPSHVCL